MWASFSHSLLTTYYSLLTTHYSLRTTYLRLVALALLLRPTPLRLALDHSLFRHSSLLEVAHRVANRRVGFNLLANLKLFGCCPGLARRARPARHRRRPACPQQEKAGRLAEVALLRRCRRLPSHNLDQRRCTAYHE